MLTKGFEQHAVPLFTRYTLLQGVNSEQFHGFVSEDN